MGDFFNVTLLALLQGVAEFLPISSSGHLVIGQHILSVKDAGMRLNVVLHFGTLLSVAVYYRATLLRMIVGRDVRYFGKILLSAVPAILAYALFHDMIDSMFVNARMVGCMLMFTGVLLSCTRFLPSGTKDVSVPRALWMGVMQSIALIPGVSRSGMTLAAARSAGVEPAKSAEFSFLMSAPLILGGMGLELWEMFGSADGGQDGVGTGLLVWGAALAAVTGYFSLVILVKALKGRWFWLFGLYCLIAGILTFCFL